ncbi:superinfection immunity protein [Helicobacter sp. faydin-H20]|uniref:superinfection immunity protein n=1 Tax=Helicobacter anatolicus TaxID=2905874 RepID=UPI001E56714E|nr:superinfection immunity protein [Helicobacter anatolicus]MCE3037095.1 superinfection immunity protein [Helicobacter anatolicus]MCE3038697.1 superinfection immunity protein [Helicobacter anatolicus]
MQKITIIDGIEISEQLSPIMDYLLLFFLFLIGFCIYFLPTFIAFYRKSKYRYSILVINFFLGFTLLAWVISLAWSVYNTGNKQEK